MRCSTTTSRRARSRSTSTRRTIPRAAFHADEVLGSRRSLDGTRSGSGPTRSRALRLRHALRSATRHRSAPSAPGFLEGVRHGGKPLRLRRRPGDAMLRFEGRDAQFLRSRRRPARGCLVLRHGDAWVEPRAGSTSKWDRAAECSGSAAGAAPSLVDVAKHLGPRGIRGFLEDCLDDNSTLAPGDSCGRDYKRSCGSVSRRAAGRGPARRGGPGEAPRPLIAGFFPHRAIW